MTNRKGARRASIMPSTEYRPHRKIACWQELRQAPSLGSDSAIKRAIVDWCCAGTDARKGGGWRQLGRAVLFKTVGAALVGGVRDSLGGEASLLVFDWLRWHRRRKAFSSQDLTVAKKHSRARGLWLVVNRGAAFTPTPSTAVAASSHTRSLSDRAARILLALRTSRLIRCDVGRLPLHLNGELLPAKQVHGRIAGRVWVARQKGAASEEELIQLLAPGGRAQAPGRRVLQDKDGWQWLDQALRGVGGQKIMSLHGLLALRGKGTGVGHGRPLDLRRVRASTLIAGRGLKVVLLSRQEEGGISVVELSAQDWASMMGVPTATEHPLRRGLRFVSEGAARSLVGQAVHFGVARAVLSEVLVQLGLLQGLSAVNYASLLSGIDFVAAALHDLVGTRMNFALAAEASRTAATALLAAWGDRIKAVEGNALNEGTAQALAGLRGGVDILMISLRCAPWSAANLLPVASAERAYQVERALEECQALLHMSATAYPRAIILECVDGGRRKGLRRKWGQLQGLVLQLREWEWSWQLICSRDTLLGYVPRSRAWLVGLRRLQ